MASVRTGSEGSNELGPHNIEGASSWALIKDDTGVGDPSARLAESQVIKPMTLSTVGDPMLPLDDPRYWAAKWLAPTRRDWRRREGAAALLVLSGLVGGGCATALAIYLMGSQGGHSGVADRMFRQEPISSAASRPSPMPPAREGSGQAPADERAAAATSWVGPAGMAAQPDAAVEPTEAPKSAAAAQPAEPFLASDEIALLTRRAETYIANGDFVSARLLLEHAAAARDARAALILAATYDPDGLRRLGLPAKAGLTLDTAMAKSWYERAVKYGSADASRLLASLIGTARH
jgi:hypothetical protein